MPKFLKKKEVISDSGVSLVSNLIDFTVILMCSLVILLLIALAVLAYIGM